MDRHTRSALWGAVVKSIFISAGAFAATDVKRTWPSLVGLPPLFCLSVMIFICVELRLAAPAIWGEDVARTSGKLEWKRRFAMGWDLFKFMLAHTAPLLIALSIPNLVLALLPTDLIVREGPLWLLGAGVVLALTFLISFPAFGLYCPLIAQHRKETWPIRLAPKACRK